ncbi:MAG: TetR family transcriptional regulator [Rhodoblastus sp.]|nr:TetR family transcriptional regulator [Rhodoblastus sp.]
MAANAEALQARAPNTKDRLMAAAREIMTERNAVEFSLQDVAARSGLNSALVKYHFGNKDGLLLAILERDAEISLKQVEKLLAREMPATQKLSLHMSGIIETYFRKPYMNRLVHMLVHERGDEAAQQVSRFFVEPLARFQRQMLEEGVKSGEFKEVDPGFFYHAVGSACDALFRWHPESRRIWGVATINDAQRRRYADFVVDLVLNGLVKR